MDNVADLSPGNEWAEPHIGLFLLCDFHATFLSPLEALLKDEFPCLITSDPQALIEHRPRVVIMSDRPPPELRRALPHTLFVGTRHGYGSKNYNQVSVPGFDFVCLSSDWVREAYLARGVFPRLGYWVTGFVATDALLHPLAHTLPPDLPADFKGGPTLLYAPTFNEHLRSIEMLGTDWIARLRETSPEVNVIVKPHPHTTRYPQAMALLQELARHERTLLIDPNQDVYPFLRQADLLLTDVSSVMFFYLALDRPIVLVNNPKRSQDPHFDPQGEEWAWRDMALQIERAEELPGAIRQSLAHPQEKAQQRAVYRERIYGQLLDGRAAERIAAKVRALLKPSAAEREWVDLAWTGLRSINGLAAAMARRPAYPENLSIPLTAFPALRAAAQSPQVKVELGKMVSMVLGGQLGQALPPAQAPPSRPQESSP